MNESNRNKSPRIPAGIWVLGFVSMLADISSEMIHSLLPVFMVSVLGASALTVGLVEGVAEATALIVKVFSGTLSDYLGRRKMLAVIGYGLEPVMNFENCMYLSTCTFLRAVAYSRNEKTQPRSQTVSERRK